jgi:hypothetical protein
MKAIVMVGLALGFFGCAAPYKIRLAAQREDYKAKQLAAVGDRYGAAKASAAAEKQYEKATARDARQMASANTYYYR